MNVLDVERVVSAEELVLIATPSLQLVQALLPNWLPGYGLELFEDVLEWLRLSFLEDVGQVVETLIKVGVTDVLPGLDLVFLLLLLLLYEHTEPLDDVLNEVSGLCGNHHFDLDDRDW